MSRFEIRNGARLAATAGLGLALTFGVAPVVALGDAPEVSQSPDETTAGNDEGEKTDNVLTGVGSDEGDSALTSPEDGAGDSGLTETASEVTYETESGTTTGSLAEALKSVKAGGTITLNVNVMLTEPVNVDKKVTLNLNGKTIARDADGWTDEATADYLVAVKRSGDLTITDTSPERSGAITTDTLACGVKVTTFGENSDEYPAVLTVNGGTIQGKYYGISGNGTRHNTKIVINGGIVQALDPEGTGIYHPQYGSLTVNGGTISGNTGIEIRSGSLVMTGGSVSGSPDVPVFEPNPGGTTTRNTGIAVSQHTTKNPVDVTITGGTVSGGAAVYESSPQDNQDDNPVNVTIRDAELNGYLISAGFGDVDVTNTTVNGNVSKTGTGSMGVTRSTITGNVTKGPGNSGTIGFVNSEILGEEAPEETVGDGVTYVKSTVNGEMRDTNVSESEAMVSGARYDTLEDAIKAAKDGDTVTLLNDVVLDGTSKFNNEGILTITKDIILEGNDRTITAENVLLGEGTAAGPSMINIEGGADVTVRNLVIDGGGSEPGVDDNTKHGLNVYGEGTKVTVENVTCKNGNGYGVVINGAEATISGLTTSGNGWGGVNVDSKSGPASLVIDKSDIDEPTSIKIENSSDDSKPDPFVKIEGGTYRYVTTGDEIKTLKLTISGGKFDTDVDTGALDGVVNPGDHVEDGLVWDASTGEVEKEPEPSVPSGPSTPSAPTYDVTVPEAEGGKVTVSDASPEEGDKVTVTATPDEGQEVREVVVTDAEGNKIEVTPGEDGTYTFEMPKGDVTVEVTFGCDGGGLCPTHSYADLDQAEWYHDAVDWAVTSGAILGYGDGTFGPGRSLTRAEMATILCRLAGEPEADLEGLPSDVPATEWYANGVAWALAEGVFNGNGDGSFDPAGAITREQAACVLYNRAQAAGEDVSARADLSAFADADELSGWAEEAMSWAVAEGVFSGGAAGLEPGRALTRSEGAAILWNWETRE
ncbi:S-layer homology domain-containing protein [Olsenella sp. An293]|uniref:S-layer homology domain-containing protein n=1 Tax=Olsenella sp. An293 TaxID=1965626 RepID=UPI001180460B|nr:S-layer homology domain-containing protein [Olsenella sp. An293]